MEEIVLNHIVEQESRTYFELNQQEEVGPRNFNPAAYAKHKLSETSIVEILSNSLRDVLIKPKFPFEPEETSWYEMCAKYEESIKHTSSSSPLSDQQVQDWLNRQILNKRFLSPRQFQKLDALGVIWDSLISRDHAWEMMFTKLEQFSQKFEHCRVPHQWAQDKPLALWVMRQRKMFLQGKILEYRKQRLNELGFTWQARDVYNDQWENYLQQLIAFQNQYGHGRVPGELKNLVSWMERQRLAKKKLQLSVERINRLNEINFIWDFDEIKKNDWEAKYKELLQFYKKHGHSFVPTNYKENKPLGTWIALQRKIEASGKLSNSRLKKLNQVQFVWGRDSQKQLKSIYDKQWENNFEKTKAYKKLHGTCQISLKSEPVLQTWTSWQRKKFNIGKMPVERVKRLNEIAFPWNADDAYWMKMFDDLTKFHIAHGHINVPSKWTENPRLSSWVYRIRSKKYKLDVEKTALLNSMGFDWTEKKKIVIQWPYMYRRLLSFKNHYGHTRVPVQWRQDPKLGKWVSRMRSERSKLSEARLTLLETIDFDWGSAIKKSV